jgi:hypothetical protein
MPVPAAKKNYALENMVSKTTAPRIEMQGSVKTEKGPKISSHGYRGNKTHGKYESTSGGKTKLGSLGRKKR